MPKIKKFIPKPLPKPVGRPPIKPAPVIVPPCPGCGN